MSSGEQVLQAEAVGARARLGWMALVLTPGMGAIRSVKAMRRLGQADPVFEASLTELEGSGMPAQSAQFVFEGRALVAAESELKRVLEAGGSILTMEDDEYPKRVRGVHPPPAG